MEEYVSALPADGLPAQRQGYRSDTYFVAWSSRTNTDHDFSEVCKCERLDDELLLILEIAGINVTNCKKQAESRAPPCCCGNDWHINTLAWQLGACRERNRRFGCRACSWCMGDKNYSSNCCLAVSLRRLALLLRLLVRVDRGGVALHSSSACGSHSALGHALAWHARTPQTMELHLSPRISCRSHSPANTSCDPVSQICSRRAQKTLINMRSCAPKRSERSEKGGKTTERRDQNLGFFECPLFCRFFAQKMVLSIVILST